MSANKIIIWRESCYLGISVSLKKSVKGCVLRRTLPILPFAGIGSISSTVVRAMESNKAMRMQMEGLRKEMIIQVSRTEPKNSSSQSHLLLLPTQISWCPAC